VKPWCKSIPAKIVIVDVGQPVILIPSLSFRAFAVILSEAKNPLGINQALAGGIARDLISILLKEFLLLACPD